MSSGGEASAHESNLNVVIVGLMLAMSLPAFDLLILATAAKAVNEDIGGNVAWMFISFQITLVASMPLYGKLGDIYGRKRTFQISVVLFVLAFAALQIGYLDRLAIRVGAGTPGDPPPGGRRSPDGSRPCVGRSGLPR